MHIEKNDSGLFGVGCKTKKYWQNTPFPSNKYQLKVTMHHKVEGDSWLFLPRDGRGLCATSIN